MDLSLPLRGGHHRQGPAIRRGRRTGDVTQLRPETTISSARMIEEPERETLVELEVDLGGEEEPVLAIGNQSGASNLFESLDVLVGEGSCEGRGVRDGIGRTGTGKAAADHS